MGQKYIMKFYNGRAIQIPYFDKMDFSQLASKAGIDISGFDSGEMEAGMKEELEHKDVTGGNPVLTFKIVAAHLKEDTNYYSKLESAMSKGGPGSGRHPEGYNPLRRDAKFGDEIVFNTGGETLRGTIAGKNEKGELKVVTNSGTIHFRNRNELGMPQGGYKQKGE